MSPRWALRYICNRHTHQIWVVTVQIFFYRPWERFAKGKKNHKIQNRFYVLLGQDTNPCENLKCFLLRIALAISRRWKCVSSLTLAVWAPDVKQGQTLWAPLGPLGLLGGTCQREAAGGCQRSGGKQRRKCSVLTLLHMVTTEQKDCHKMMEPLKFWDLNEKTPIKFIHTSLSIGYVISRQRKMLH